MASIRVKFRPSSIVGKKGSVYYRIIHERQTRQLPTDYKIYPCEWSEKRGIVMADRNPARVLEINALREHVRRDMERLTRIIRRLDDRGTEYTADDIVDEFTTYARDYSLFNYMETQISALRRRCNTNTVNNYIGTLNSIRNFRQGKDVMLDAISAPMMLDYEAYLRNRGLTPNSTSFYMRNLRAIYHRAIEEGAINDMKPFRHVYTGVDKTVKRALPIAAIKKIKELSLDPDSRIGYARNMFMLSFYLRGMSFIDMAFLRKKDKADGYVTYRRHKTGKLLRIEWTQEMQDIIDLYPENTSGYLLPILKNETSDGRKEYRTVAHNINYHLRKIAALAGVNITLTLYCARHSWASSAKSIGIPISIISDAMGHESETTTQIYLASLETEAVDKANSRILKCL